MVGITTMSRMQIRCGSFQQNTMMSAKLLGADEIGIAQSLAIRIKTDAAATALPIP
ncbi:MAG: hypothetical protein ACXWJ8_05425 [Xanthobacteraceae bacterium]